MGTNLLPTGGAVKEGEIPDTRTIQTMLGDDEFTRFMDLDVPSTLQKPGEGIVVEYDPKAFSFMSLMGDYFIRIFYLLYYLFT